MFPSDACVCRGQAVQFNCTIHAVVNGEVVGTTDQRWEVHLTSSTVINLDSVTSGMNPEGYEFVPAAGIGGGATGLRVLSPDLSLNQARLTCTGYDSNLPTLDPGVCSYSDS